MRKNHQPVSFFNFVDSTVTTTAIVDLLYPLLPLTKNGLFQRNDDSGVLHVTHPKGKPFTVSFSVNKVVYPLTDTEMTFLKVFYTQRV